MAVRFSADGQDFTRAIALGAITSLSLACWFKLSADRNTWSTPWSLDNGISNNWCLQTGSDGTTMAMVADGNTSATNMGSLTVGTWYFACFAWTGSGSTLYYRAASASSLTSSTPSVNTGSLNAATLRIGESPWGTEWLNGCVAAFKLWSGIVLTADEALAESYQYLPVRVAGLTSFHPFIRTETTDYSGNARTLTGGTGSTTEDGPPIMWKGVPARILKPAATGGTTVVLGQATETSIAQAVDANKVRSIGQVAQADLAQPVDANKVRAIAQVTEADTAQPVTRFKRRTVNQATETDLAQIIRGVRARLLAQTTESDIAQSVTGVRAKILGQATETDAAQPVSRLKRRTTTQATETDAAQPVDANKARTVAQATETGIAQPVARLKLRTIAQAAEADTAQPVTRFKRRTIGQPVETDAAQPVTLRTAGTIIIGQAVETSSVQPLRGVRTRTLGQPAEANAAQPVDASKVRAIMQATESNVATLIKPAKIKSVAQALEVDAAQFVDVNKLRAIVQALELDSARPFTIQGETEIVIGQAIEVDAANAMILHRYQQTGFAVKRIKEGRPDYPTA